LPWKIPKPPQTRLGGFFLLLFVETGKPLPQFVGTPFAYGNA
jgi:hypothetical protein